jgi:hypothetical protein
MKIITTSVEWLPPELPDNCYWVRGDDKWILKNKGVKIDIVKDGTEFDGPSIYYRCEVIEGEERWKQLNTIGYSK